MNEKQARKWAQEQGISVSKTIIENGIRVITVGSQRVEWNPATGGCGCYKVNGHGHAYVGDAIHIACLVERGELHRGRAPGAHHDSWLEVKK